MAGVTKREFWDFRVKTRAQFTKLAEQIANIDTSGGGGISELTSKMVVDALGYTPYNATNPANYITASALTPYALKTDIPSLVGYATEDFVTTKLVNYAPLTSVQGFENRIGGLESAVPQLNERVTTVEGKVSSLNELVSTGENNLLDRVNVIEEEYATKTYVDNAIDGIDLSPYLKTEDAEGTYATKDFVNNKLTNYATIGSVTAIQNTLTGQIGAVGASVEQLASTKLDSSYFTLTNIKSTLGISDWALAATKPSYTAAEVGALSLDGTSKMQQSKNIVWSNTEGDEDIDVFSNGLRLLGYNVSKGNYGGGIHIGTRYGWQLMTKWGENPLYYRSYNINSQIWRDWETLAFVSDIPTKLSQLTDDVVAGKYLPLSGGTVTGSVLFNKHTQFASSAYFYSNVIVENTSHATILFKPNGLAHYLGVSTGGGLFFTNNGWNETYTILHSGNIGNYNAGSATKLQTRRTLWGQSFDGTNNISGAITLANNQSINVTFTDGTIKNALLLASSNNNLYLGYGTALSGASTFLWGKEIQFVNSSGQPIATFKNSKLGIGTESPTELLDVVGNVKSSGNISANSITINGVTISSNGTSITVNGNVFATGDITGGV